MAVVQNISQNIRERIKKHGRKAVFGIFIYYLIRDLTLYVLVPYLLFK